MDWSRIPSLNSLRAFFVLAETGSYAKAATELNVTHAAVSQQVKALEADLGVSLAARQGRGVRLTDEGTALARDLNTAFAAIRRGVETLTDSDALRSVRITTSPAFAVEWLMPRIAEFQQRHPEITLMLNPTAEVVELKQGGVDVAIRYRARDRLDGDVSPLLVSDMIVAGASSLLGGREIGEISSLVEIPWLQELNTNEVADWFARRGIILDRPLMISQMPGNLIMQAVRRGDGISYTARAFFQEDIQAGRIKVLHSEPAFGLYVVETGPGASRPAVRTFMNWLRTKSETVTVQPLATGRGPPDRQGI